MTSTTLLRSVNPTATDVPPTDPLPDLPKEPPTPPGPGDPPPPR